MIKFLLTLLFLFPCFVLPAQTNCETQTTASCIEACKIDKAARRAGQGTRQSQELFDESIRLCPTFADAYYEKSVPYLKRGQLKEWKELMDKAVALDSMYLLQRGTNRVTFIKDYHGGLEDLTALYDYVGAFNIGYNPSGEYHGQMLRAICYQKTGQVDRAIEIMEQLVNAPNYHRDIHDYFHLGVAYLEKGDLEKAAATFAVQNEQYEYAEVCYYLAKIHEHRGEEKSKDDMLSKAKMLYQRGQTMDNGYYHYTDKVFLRDIEKG